MSGSAEMYVQYLNTAVIAWGFAAVLAGLNLAQIFAYIGAIALVGSACLFAVSVLETHWAAE